MHDILAGGENVHIFRLNHLPACYLVVGDPMESDESRCSCGAIESEMALDVFTGKNLITSDGAIFYAQLAQKGFHDAFNGSLSRGTDITPTETLAYLYLANGASSVPDVGNDFSDLAGVVNSSGKLVTTNANGTYPLTNDTADSDNTGDGTNVLTWTFEFAAGEATATGIVDVAISRASASGTNPLLNHAEVTSFDKTATDTLKVIINHTFEDPSA